MNKKIEETRHFKKHIERYNAFINVVHVYWEQINCSPHQIHAGLSGGLDMALRIMTGSHASFISIKLLNKLKESNSKINPFSCLWEDRHKLKIKVNDKSETPIWEHTIPISEVRKKIISLPSKEEINSYLLEYPGIAWITKEENQILNSLKYQKSRPNGFLECYNHAKIQLINIEMYDSMNGDKQGLHFS